MTYEIVSNWLNANFSDNKILFILFPIITFTILSLVDRMAYSNNRSLSLSNRSNFSFSKFVFGLIIGGCFFYLIFNAISNPNFITGLSNVKGQIINNFHS